MATFTTYTDVPDFLQNATAHIETATLVGGNTVLTSAVTAGATSLPVQSVSGFPSSGTATVWLFDGAASERVTASVIGGALSVPAGVVATHASGIAVVSAGSAGCLADVIVRASRDIESHCRQGQDGGTDRSLFAITRTEVLRGPSVRAAWDSDGTLVLRPWHFPVGMVTAVQVRFGSNAPVSVALAAPVLTDGRLIELPLQQNLPLPNDGGDIIALRQSWFTATVTYTAGPCVGGAVPDDIRQACHLLVADILAERRNPEGAAEVQLGKARYAFRLRGDGWTSALREHAYELLQPYAE